MEEDDYTRETAGVCRSKTVPPLPLASNSHRGTYKTWTEAQMEKAMNVLAMNETLSVRQASLQFNVPKSMVLKVVPTSS